MNGLPEYDSANDPHPTQAPGAEDTESAPNPEAAQGWRPDEYAVTTPSVANEYPFPHSGDTEHPPEPERPMFESWYQPPQVRIPHLGHLAILGVFAMLGMVGALVPFWVGLRFHWFGVTSLRAAATDIHYTLGSEAVLYLVMLGACMLFFPMIWNKGFFAGIQWNGATALRLRQQLFLTAAICFALALVNGLLLPGPKDAPIDKIFRTPGAAWLLFGFGVTIAPFAEELIFRGFLLPALCTGADWIAEKRTAGATRCVNDRGCPHWPVRVIVYVSAVFASAPAAAAIAFLALHGLSSLFFLLAYGLSLALFLTLLAIPKFKAPQPPLALGANDHPVWSFPAMVIGSFATSIPFAAMHAAQTGYAFGPFILLVGVSLALCWARLSTRSLAASVLVHASYNFLLFALMMLGTGGFRHLDKM